MTTGTRIDSLTVCWKSTSVTSTTIGASAASPAGAAGWGGRARADRSTAPCRLIEGWLIGVLAVCGEVLTTTLPLAVALLLILGSPVALADVREHLRRAEDGDRLLAALGRHGEGDGDEVVGAGLAVDAGVLLHEETEVPAGLEGRALDRAAQVEAPVDDPDDERAALSGLHGRDGALTHLVAL